MGCAQSSRVVIRHNDNYNNGYIENEDNIPFDNDNDVDHEKYHSNDNGLMIKTRDFRSRFVDENQVKKRPQVSSSSLYIDTEFPLKTAICTKNTDVEWKRPKEFIKDPRLFTNGGTLFDTGQGLAGTCWFLSIVAGIAGNKKVMQQVIPQDAYTIEDPSRYDGVFHARFYNFGKWEDVYIDDYLPVLYKTQLWGARSATNKNEMWVSLLEKAFAKMHGSYDALYGGQPGDAYLQLTSGVGEHIKLQDNKNVDNAKILFDRFKNAFACGSQIACFAPEKYDKFKGLVGDHAYSVIGVFEHKAIQTKLINVRNPWGRGEWTGAWSDGSPEWKKIPNSSEIAPKKDDGKFYMSISDFMKYFDQITICSLTPDFDCNGISGSLNYLLNIYGEWNGKTAAGFHNLLQNQRFCFTVTNNGLVDKDYLPLVVQIVQQSKTRKTDKISVRCDVFKVLADKIQPRGRCIALEIMGTKNNVYTSDTQTLFRHKLRPGQYVIVASTIDEGLEKAFLLRLFTSAPLKNITEIPVKADVMSCENDSTFDINGKTLELTFQKVLFGEFIKGKNAGGQVSNRDSFQLNPQYLITIPEKGNKTPLVIHIMQNQEEPLQPIGIRIFELDDATTPPLDTKYLYDHYNDSPADLDGSQYKFMTSRSVAVKYLLKPGRYIALVHLDKPNMERSFSILFKSIMHVDIKEMPVKSAAVVYFENEHIIAIKGTTHELTFQKVLTGKFIKGKNAGGQVSNRDSYQLNPQYLITIPGKGSEVPLVVHIIQTQDKPIQAIGIRIFKLDDATMPPLDSNYLYDQYDSSPTDLAGSQSTFMISLNVDARYLLKSGRYVVLVFLDKPNIERSFRILFKSTVPVDIKFPDWIKAQFMDNLNTLADLQLKDVKIPYTT